MRLMPVGIRWGEIFATETTEPSTRSSSTDTGASISTAATFGSFRSRCTCAAVSRAEKPPMPCLKTCLGLMPMDRADLMRRFIWVVLTRQPLAMSPTWTRLRDDVEGLDTAVSVYRTM